MRAIIDKINIESIQFESGYNEVSVFCTMTQGRDTFQSELKIDYSDLNRLLGRMMQMNSEIEMNNWFEEIQLENGESYYSFNSARLGMENVWIEELEFYHPMKQIRA